MLNGCGDIRVRFSASGKVQCTASVFYECSETLFSMLVVKKM